MVYNEQDGMNKAKKHEKDIAKVIGGQRQPGSGAFYWAKSDVISKKGFRGECKLTEGESIRVTVDVIKKISKEAFGAHQEPLLALRFMGMKYPYDADWIAVPARVFEKLIEGEEKKGE